MRIIHVMSSLFISLLLTACGPSRQAFNLPPSAISANASWAQIQQQAATLELHTLLTGQVKVPRGGVLDQSNPKTQALHIKQQPASLWVDVYSHWLRHPQKGDYLIDSGLDQRFANHPQGSVKGIIASWIIEDSRQDQGQDIASQLQQSQIQPNGVFLTHIHGDHSSGIPALPLGIAVVVGAGEPQHHYPLIMYSDHFDPVSTLYELEFDHGMYLDQLGPALDIFGDGSLWAISTPGHTAGHVSYLAHDINGWVLLTGDASHTRWGFENGVIPGWSENDEQAQQSLDMLTGFIKRHPDVRVVLGHQD
jgi:N-acyl homoserine lactone hydrolase